MMEFAILLIVVTLGVGGLFLYRCKAVHQRKDLVDFLTAYNEKRDEDFENWKLKQKEKER